MNARKANSIPISSYLEAKGILPTKTTNSYSMYQAPYRNDSKASLKVSHQENFWIDYGNNEGGTLIDLVLKISPQLNVSEAIKDISATTNSYFSFHQQKTLFRKQSNNEESRFRSWSAPDPKHDSMSESLRTLSLFAGRGKKISKKYTSKNGGDNRYYLISKNDAGKVQYLKDKKSSINIYKLQELGNSSIITSYLNQRGIQIPTAIPYCKEIYYQVNEKRYFGLAHKNNKGWSIRNKYWKGCTSQGYSYFSNNQDTLLIFEGIFDMLSFQELIPTKCTESDFLILNSLINTKQVLLILEQYKSINLYLDHDEAGRKATRRIILRYPHAEDTSNFYHPFKDLNEYYLKKRKVAQLLLRRKCKSICVF